MRGWGGGRQGWGRGRTLPHSYTCHVSVHSSTLLYCVADISSRLCSRLHPKQLASGRQRSTVSSISHLSHYSRAATQLERHVKHRRTKQQNRPRACLIRQLRRASQESARSRGEYGEHLRQTFVASDEARPHAPSSCRQRFCPRRRACSCSCCSFGARVQGQHASAQCIQWWGCLPSLDYAKPNVNILEASRPAIDGQRTAKLAIERWKQAARS